MTTTKRLLDAVHNNPFRTASELAKLVQCRPNVASGILNRCSKKERALRATGIRTANSAMWAWLYYPVSMKNAEEIVSQKFGSFIAQHRGDTRFR